MRIISPMVAPPSSTNSVPVEKVASATKNKIMAATDSKDIGVYIQAEHGCCTNRGIMAHSSLTQTTVLRGAFKTDPGTTKEFMDNIKQQQEFAPR